MDLLYETIHHGDYWIDLLDISMGGEKPVEALRNLPFRRESVIEFASCISDAIYMDASFYSTSEPYRQTLEAGHEFLKMIHEIANEKGVQVELREINGPLSLGEVLSAEETDEDSADEGHIVH